MRVLLVFLDEKAAVTVDLAPLPAESLNSPRIALPMTLEDEKKELIRFCANGKFV